MSLYLFPVHCLSGWQLQRVLLIASDDIPVMRTQQGDRREAFTMIDRCAHRLHEGLIAQISELIPVHRRSFLR